MQVVHTDKRLPLGAAWGLRLGGGQAPSFPIQYSEALFCSLSLLLLAVSYCGTMGEDSDGLLP